MSQKEQQAAGKVDLQAQQPDPNTNQDRLQKIRDIIESADAAMLTTVTDKRLISRPMKLQEAEKDGALWFITGKDSSMAGELAHDPRVNVSFIGRGYLSVSGQAELVEDPAQRKAAWKAWAERYFEKALDDPSLMLIRVDVLSAEYWEKPGRLRSFFTDIAQKAEDYDEGDGSNIVLRGM